MIVIQKHLKVYITFAEMSQKNPLTDSESFGIKSRFLNDDNNSNNNNGGIINVEIAVPLKYWSNLWRALDMSLINCKIHLILTWSVYFVISEGNIVTTFAIAGTKCYVPAVTLSTNDNAKLLQQLKSGFKHTINWYKYHSTVTIERKSLYFDYLIDPNY